MTCQSWRVCRAVHAVPAGNTASAMPAVAAWRVAHVMHTMPAGHAWPAVSAWPAEFASVLSSSLALAVRFSLRCI